MSWHAGLLGDGDVDWPRVLLLALAATVVLTVGAVAATSSASFGPYNPTWDGSSEFREDVQAAPGVEHHLIRDAAEYEELPANDTVAFVVAPDEPYEDEDAARVREFVAEGGTLVVLENRDGASNELLADVGAEARADGRLLRDEQHHFRGPTMPVAADVGNHTLATGIEQLTLNYATAVDPGNATVLVATSEFAYLGSEDDGLDEGDELRSYPVATAENVSNGQVVVVGDPSVTINAMYDEPDNAAFVRGLYDDADHVVVDRSHGDDVPPLTAAVLTVRDSPWLQLLVGTAGIGLVAVLSRVRVRSVLETVRAVLPARFRSVEGRSGGGGSESSRLGLSEHDRVEYLRRRHPEWDDDQVKRMATAFNNHRMEEDGHE